MKNTTITIPERLRERFQALIERGADRWGESPAQAKEHQALRSGALQSFNREHGR
jgi:hypothetical protein